MNLSNFSFFFLNFFKHFSWHLVIFPIELVITSDSSFFSSINFMTSTFPAEDSLSLFGVTTGKHIRGSLKRKNKKSWSHIINMPVGWISTYCLLRSRPLPYSCLFSLYGLLLVGLWGHLLVWLHPPFWWLVWMQPCWEYILVIFGMFAACLSFLCLACMLGFLVLAFLCAL